MQHLALTADTFLFSDNGEEEEATMATWCEVEEANVSTWHDKRH
jgi:hypothetical protein